ncbi:MAG TPA: YiiD C-terminal domain-containing protein [Chthoniobacterales bacterium]|nr:YiiD C-terminal domain-containing protein [Chthoniobacterales bacterium]
MTTANPLLELEEFLHQRIPLTRAMGLRAVESSDRGLVVAAPVALNRNHLGTAFGGSINAVATVAGYGLLWLALRNEAADMVVRDSAIRYIRPIHETIRAVCARPGEDEWRAFKTAFGARGKARISLRVRIEEADRVAAEFEGTFVALRRAAD